MITLIDEAAERTKWGLIVGGIILVIILIAAIYFIVKRCKARRKTYESVVVGMSSTNPSSSTQPLQQAAPVQYNNSPLTTGYAQPPAYQSYGNYPGIFFFLFGILLHFTGSFLEFY